MDRPDDRSSLVASVALVIAVVVGATVGVYGSAVAAIGGAEELARGNPIHAALLWALAAVPWLIAAGLVRAVGVQRQRWRQAGWLCAVTGLVGGFAAFVGGVIPFISGM